MRIIALACLLTLSACQMESSGVLDAIREEKKLLEEVTEPDRAWFALAAYNVGIGHIYDARRLVERLGKNPNSWADLSQTLPLLSQEKYFKTLRHGYARGQEPVLYVQRIRDYEDILRQRHKLASNSRKQSATTSFFMSNVRRYSYR